MIRQKNKGYHLPYNTDLKQRSRQLRNKMTHSERIIWKKILRKGQLDNHRFLRQKPINNFILDFYCSKLRLGIEIDGGIHNNKRGYDKERTNILSDFNIKIIRYTNHEIQNSLTKIDINLRKEIKLREKELSIGLNL